MALSLEYLKIQGLRAYQKNARTHSDEQIEQLVNSIREFGFTNPVLVDENSELIAGHGRTAAAKKLGMEEVPAIRLVGLSDDQKKALRIADNQLALNAGWDLDLLAEEVADLQEADFDINLLGFEDEFLDELLADLEEDEGSVGDGEADSVPEMRPDPITRTGDIWKLGKHRVMCGDSLSIDNVEQLMDGQKVDLLLTDPPYNVAYEGKTADALTIENDEMGDDDFRQFLRDAYSTADSVMKPGAAFYIWHADSEGYNFRGAAKDVGWRVRQCLIWNKNSLVLGRQDYHWKHEPCLYGWKEGAAHYWGSDRSQTTVLDFNRPTRNGDHPTMKPVELFAYQIENSCPPGGVVLDLFGGSGTTAIAAQTTGRVARLMELDPRYVDVIVRRWQEITGQDAVLASTGETFDAILLRERGEVVAT